MEISWEYHQHPHLYFNPITLPNTLAHAPLKSSGKEGQFQDFRFFSGWSWDGF